MNIMSPAAFSLNHLTADAATDILDHKWTLRISGVLAIALGAFSIIMPHIATFAANIFIGAILAGSGFVDAILAFRARKAKRIAVKFFLGLLSLIGGVFLLIFPLAGVLSLTIFLASYFLVSGIMKGIFAFKMRQSKRWGWMLISALLSLALGAMVFLGLPGTAFWVLGMIVGVDLIFSGIAVLMLIPRAKELAAFAADEKPAEQHSDASATPPLVSEPDGRPMSPPNTAMVTADHQAEA